MLTRPEQISDPELLRAVADAWLVDLRSVEYRPVGFGSHHWLAADADGGRWFVTVDDLSARVADDDESPDAVHDRLRAALRTARAVRDTGAAFVVAPTPRPDGEVLHRLDRRFVAALYPYVDGAAGDFSDLLSAADRRSVLSLLAILHDSPVPTRRDAGVDDLGIQARDRLDDALAALTEPWDTGPYGEPTRRLLAWHGARLEGALSTYDRHAEATVAAADRKVLTHGEPHPGNLIRTASGWRLVDWDTVLVAPPERDLWLLDPGDGSVATTYTEMTGRPVHPEVMELYRLRWALTDIALYVSGFRAPHTGSSDDDASWSYLEGTLARLGGSAGS